MVAIIAIVSAASREVNIECKKKAAAAQSERFEEATLRITICSKPRLNNVVKKTDTAFAQLMIPKSSFDKRTDVK